MTRIYLDNQATAPIDPRVLDAMMPFLSAAFGNPHSTGHDFGREAAEAVEVARGQVAALIGAEPAEIVFTSGATESNNLALKGAARFAAKHRPNDTRRRVVTLATEHKCVLESARDLAEEGFDPVVLPVRGDGLVDLDLLARSIDESVLLVSIMAAHNEIGVIQDLAAIGAMCRRAGALFHTDAAQGFGKIPLDVGAMTIDLMSISGHKIYAPKGVGALYVRRRPRVRLQPLFSGGGQERGLRSGTLSPLLCVGLGKAAALAADEMAADAERIRTLSQHLLRRLNEVGGVRLNGAVEPRLALNLNLSFAGVKALDLLRAVPDVALSAGSACTSASVEPSYVLAAMGLEPERQEGGIRIGLSRFTTAADIDAAGERIAEAVLRLRN